MSHSRLAISLALLVVALIISIVSMDFSDHSVMVSQYYIQIWIPAVLSMGIGAVAMRLIMSKMASKVGPSPQPKVGPSPQPKVGPSMREEERSKVGPKEGPSMHDDREYDEVRLPSSDDGHLSSIEKNELGDILF